MLRKANRRWLADMCYHAPSLEIRGEKTRSILRSSPRGDATPSGRRTVQRVPHAPDTGDNADRSSGGVRLPYLPGLDGIRALAVIAVLLYHAGVPWIPGGFLGVEVFFVLSGYLITSLLLAEWRAKGSVELKVFWLRRARRLLPALYLLIVVTLSYAVLFLPEEVAGLRSDALAAFGYATNWYLIFGHESYFEAVGRPSLLKHLWSLAVEEQFYLVWPVLFWVGISFGAARWRHRRVFVGALGGAALSVLLLAVLYVPGADPSRLYYGTDTRAAGLLIGAALALVWTPGATRRSYPTGRLLQETSLLGRADHNGLRRTFRRRWGWLVPTSLDALGFFALGALVFFCLSLGEYAPFLYRGGLALVSLSTAAVIMAVAYPHTRLGGTGLLGWVPLRWIGERSYGIYLWHWPVFMVTRPQLDVSFDGLPLLALRLGVTVLLADLSYRYVETPIRRGVLGRAWRALREARGFKRWDLGARYATAVVPVVAVCAMLGVAVAHAKPPETPSYLSTKTVHLEARDLTPKPDKQTEKTSSVTETPDNRSDSAAAGQRAVPNTRATGREARAQAHEAAARSTGKAPAAPSDRAPEGTVTAVGDSAMLGAVDTLHEEIPNLTVLDARGSRQAPEAIGVLRQFRASGKLGDVVIVHIGNNGTFTAEEFDEMMDVLSGVRKVLVVNVTVPDDHSWAPNNEVLAAGAHRYPDKAVLVDWYAASTGHPEYFWDGIHLTPRGAQAYADTIAAAYEEHSR
jgi:peptidoglycan/LPS O-acetylase OafA/YrhL